MTPHSEKPEGLGNTCLSTDPYCPHRPVAEVWIEDPRAPHGGYWASVCRIHLDAINNGKGVND